ncbi:hypothetical protein [Deinococcus sp. JMULE3]|uniref:hypothetical protein n=1 Tax=Deinococcus sp. JMULE3 TaxID=2518341 RepID=UPI0035305125
MSAPVSVIPSAPPPAPEPAPFRVSAAQAGLIASNFLMWGGFFAVIPLVTVHFSGSVAGAGWAGVPRAWGWCWACGS